MNIQQAKQQIKHTLAAYLSKDAQGSYRLSELQQRPLLLVGPPGIGKTQIMRQIAQECGVGLVAYTITHHTRQSAVGLPMIEKKMFDGQEYTITEYTMSEIIGSVYKTIEQTGLKEGILFLDEINCVSETLAPTMLQFLQCKTFGNQKVPQGWVIITAGNPPEYNKSVREFDVVTLDRLRRMEIQPDLQVWKQYARSMQVHPAILTYLELYPEYFYRVTQDVDGIQFVTARGWEDLSALLLTYQQLGLTPEEDLVEQYLQYPEIAEDFASYFSLYQKYGEEYKIDNILKGNPSPSCYARANTATFDERLSLVGLLLAGLENYFLSAVEQHQKVEDCFAVIVDFKENAKENVHYFGAVLEQKQQEFAQQKKAQLLNKAQQKRWEICLETLQAFWNTMQEKQVKTVEDALDCLRKVFAPIRQQREEKLQSASDAVEFAFDFLEKAFPVGQELLVFVTELGMGTNSAEFLANNPSERYTQYSQNFLLQGNTGKILQEIAADRARNS